MVLLSITTIAGSVHYTDTVASISLTSSSGASSACRAVTDAAKVAEAAVTSYSGQLPVLYPVGPVRFGPQTLLTVLFVFGVVPLEPDDPALSLEGEDMGGNPVQKPP